MEVEGEVLDLTDDEARTLLLSLDPLAALAQTQSELYDRLRQQAPRPPADLEALWRATAEAAMKNLPPPPPPRTPAWKEQYLVLVECRDEHHQVELLTRFQDEGLT